MSRPSSHRSQRGSSASQHDNLSDDRFRLSHIGPQEAAFWNAQDDDSGSETASVRRHSSQRSRERPRASAVYGVLAHKPGHAIIPDSLAGNIDDKPTTRGNVTSFESIPPFHAGLRVGVPSSPEPDSPFEPQPHGLQHHGASYEALTHGSSYEQDAAQERRESDGAQYRHEFDNTFGHFTEPFHPEQQYNRPHSAGTARHSQSHNSFPYSASTGMLHHPGRRYSMSPVSSISYPPSPTTPPGGWEPWPQHVPGPSAAPYDQGHRGSVQPSTSFSADRQEAPHSAWESIGRLRHEAPHQQPSYPQHQGSFSSQAAHSHGHATQHSTHAPHPQRHQPPQSQHHGQANRSVVESAPFTNFTSLLNPDGSLQQRHHAAEPDRLVPQRRTKKTFNAAKKLFKVKRRGTK